MKLKLEELVTIVGGGTPDREVDEYWNGDIPWISVKDFKDSTISTSLESITEKGLNSSASRLIPAGNVIVPTRMALGKVAINLMDVAINQDLKALLIKDDSKLNLNYLFYFIKSNEKKIISHGKGATVKGITIDVLKDLDLELPELNVQQKIASALDVADALIQKRKEAIAKLDGLVESVFVDMFGNLNINDKKWEISELQYHANISSGVTKGKKYNDADLVSIPYMRVANVQDGYLNLSDIKEILVSTADAIRYKLQDQDVLLTEGGDPDKLGRGAVWNSEISKCIHQNHIFRVRVDKKSLNPYFLSSCTGSRYGKKYFLKMAKQTTGIATINMSQLKGFPVPLPPLDLQNKYESRLQQIGLQKQHMQNQLVKLEENFQSLLHQAFTGRLQFRDSKVDDYALKR